MYSRGITGVTSDQGSLHLKGQGIVYEAYRRLGDVITRACLVNSNLRNAQELELELAQLVYSYVPTRIMRYRIP